jgi:hypothetical protein
MNKFIHVFLICIISAVFYTGCKPDMPVRSDYPDNVPCYLADVCLTVNAYMVNNKTDCTLALQKCYRYTDYDKCKKEADPKKCWDDLGVRN